MTTLTIKVNERNKAGKAFLALADAFLKNQDGIEIVKEKKIVKPKPDKKKLMGIAEIVKRNATQRMLADFAETPKPDKKKLMELAKTIKKSATKKAFERIGLDYDSYSR